MGRMQHCVSQQNTLEEQEEIHEDDEEEDEDEEDDENDSNASSVRCERSRKRLATKGKAKAIPQSKVKTKAKAKATPAHPFGSPSHRMVGETTGTTDCGEQGGRHSDRRHNIGNFHGFQEAARQGQRALGRTGLRG